MHPYAQIAAYAAPIIAMLAAGKAVRRVVLLPFEWLRNKLKSRTLDVLLEEAERDLGIDKPTIPDEVDSRAPESKE